MSNVLLKQGLEEITRLFRHRQFSEARTLARKIADQNSSNIDVWLMLARTEQHLQNFPAMLNATQTALKYHPNNLTANLIDIEALGYCGKVDEAIAAVQKLEVPDADASAWRRIAGLHTHLGRHQDAHRCLHKAQKAGGDTVDTLLALGASEMVLGNLGVSEMLFDESIKKFPTQYEVYYTRATLRRQTVDNNHVEELQDILYHAGLKSQSVALVPLHYALAKELEDLGRWDSAFKHFSIGANLRRNAMVYNVENDLETIRHICASFGADFFTRCGPGFTDAEPVFIVGLPRSGSTLIDRILSSASTVESLGEINDFAYALMRLAGPSQGKSDLITRASTTVDLEELGSAYMQASRGYGCKALHLIDKTPLNALYVGLIAAALPNAKIIHVSRHPMANGFATFKTLFRMGYPWSYSLKDIGRYTSAHRSLMDHWRDVLPGRIIEIEYEALIADQKTVSRYLYEQCGLEWADDYLAFHKNTSPVSTASAAQVRKPLYKDAVDLWRHYEEYLSDMRTV